MTSQGKLRLIAALVTLGTAGAAGAQQQQTNPSTPTCSDTMNIAVHGQHIIGDYVTGVGNQNLDWPPGGDNIGQIVSANGGAVVPGGPGPGFHFPNGIAPGASFCNDSNSPGAHL